MKVLVISDSHGNYTHALKAHELAGPVDHIIHLGDGADAAGLLEQVLEVPVHRVVDMTTSGPSIQRELAMVKVRGKGENRVEALRLADAFRARVIDATAESFVFEITGASAKIEGFINLMMPLGVVEISRTGIAAISRGAEAMEYR